MTTVAQSGSAARRSSRQRQCPSPFWCGTSPVRVAGQAGGTAHESQAVSESPSLATIKKRSSLNSSGQPSTQHAKRTRLDNHVVHGVDTGTLKMMCEVPDDDHQHTPEAVPFRLDATTAAQQPAGAAHGTWPSTKQRLSNSKQREGTTAIGSQKAAEPASADGNTAAGAGNSSQTAGNSASRPRRKQADIAINRMRGKEAPVDLFKLVSGGATPTAASKQQASSDKVAGAAGNRPSSATAGWSPASAAAKKGSNSNTRSQKQRQHTLARIEEEAEAERGLPARQQQAAYAEQAAGEHDIAGAQSGDVTATADGPKHEQLVTKANKWDRATKAVKTKGTAVINKAADSSSHLEASEEETAAAHTLAELNADIVAAASDAGPKGGKASQRRTSTAHTAAVGAAAPPSKRNTARKQLEEPNGNTVPTTASAAAAATVSGRRARSRTQANSILAPEDQQQLWQEHIVPSQHVQQQQQQAVGQQQDISSAGVGACAGHDVDAAENADTTAERQQAVGGALISSGCAMAPISALAAEGQVIAGPDSADGAHAAAAAAGGSIHSTPGLPLAAAAVNAAAAAADAIAAALANGSGGQVPAAEHAVNARGAPQMLSDNVCQQQEVQVPGHQQTVQQSQQQLQQLQQLRSSLLARPHQLLPRPPLIRIKQRDSPPPEAVPASHWRQQQEAWGAGCNTAANPPMESRDPHGPWSAAGNAADSYLIAAGGLGGFGLCGTYGIGALRPEAVSGAAAADGGGGSSATGTWIQGTCTSLTAALQPEAVHPAAAAAAVSAPAGGQNNYAWKQQQHQHLHQQQWQAGISPMESHAALLQDDGALRPGDAVIDPQGMQVCEDKQTGTAPVLGAGVLGAGNEHTGYAALPVRPLPPAMQLHARQGMDGHCTPLSPSSSLTGVSAALGPDSSLQEQQQQQQQQQGLWRQQQQQQHSLQCGEGSDLGARQQASTLQSLQEQQRHAQLGGLRDQHYQQGSFAGELQQLQQGPQQFMLGNRQAIAKEQLAAEQQGLDAYQQLDSSMSVQQRQQEQRQLQHHQRRQLQQQEQLLLQQQQQLAQGFEEQQQQRHTSVAAGDNNSHSHLHQHQQQGAQQQLQLAMAPPKRAQPKKQQQRAKAGGASSGAGGDSWAVAEMQALQVAYCQVEPTHRFFWQEVARRVGTRTASDCFAKIFDAARSPAPAAKLPRAKIAAPLRAAGAQPGKTTLAAARKLVRGLQQEVQRTRLTNPAAATAQGTNQLPRQRVQLYVNEDQSVSNGSGNEDSGEDADKAAAAAGAGESRSGVATGGVAGAGCGHAGAAMSAEALATLQQQQQHADRYISSFIRRRGGWNKYQRQQLVLQQRQHQQQQQRSRPDTSGSINPGLNHLAAGGSNGSMGPPAARPGTAAGNNNASSAALSPRDPRRSIVAQRSSRQDADGGALTGAITKTLGVLTQQLGDWEAAQAEQEVLQEGLEGVNEGLEHGNGQNLGVRDYYFDDEAEYDIEELLGA